MTQTYTDVFGTDTIPATDSGYASVSLTADTTFYWPELSQGSYLIADKMDVTADSTWAMTMPSAAEVGNGRDVLIRNTGANTITVKDAGGNTLGTVAAGEVKLFYITSNATANGTWAVFTFGTGTSAADASTLAGYGLEATGSTLSQEMPTVAKAANYTVVSSDRANTLVFSNSGVVTCTLTGAASLGNGFFVAVSNQGTGTVTIDPNSTETVDGASTKDLAPGESALLNCDGANWVTVGYGRSTQFQFTKLVLDISSGSPFTLTSTQAQNKLIQTIGTITGAVTVNVPAVVAVYYIQCSHTGAFATTFKTAAGTGVDLNANDRAILYCDGTDVVEAQTASVPAGSIAGGAAGQVVYQTGSGTTGFSSAGTTGQIFLSGGTGAPTWSDLGVITFGYSSKATPVDADSLPLSDSEASNGPKKLTWANLKATIFASWGALVAAGTSKTTPVDGDSVALSDSAASDATKKLTWANLKATLKTYFDTLYGDMKSDGTVAMTGSLTLGGAGTGIIFEGTTADANETTLVAGEPTADRTVTLPDATTTLAGLAVAQTFTATQLGQPLTDNDGSFDLSAKQNFHCTPSGSITLTYTSIATNTGHSGVTMIYNSGGHSVSLHTNTKAPTGMATMLSAAGTYKIGTYCDGTDVHITCAGKSQ